MNQEEIFSTLVERYANCTTYCDLGCVYRWDESQQKTDKPQIVFRTYFERPSKFRFEWPDADCKSVIWCNGNESYSCSDLIQLRSREGTVCDSVAMAIAGATGVSSGSAYLVPTLLFDELREHPDRRWLLLHSDIAVKGIEESECYCIEGSNHSSHDTSIWVSKRDFSLRRYRSYTVMSQPDRKKITLTMRELSASEISGSDERNDYLTPSSEESD